MLCMCIYTNIFMIELIQTDLAYLHGNGDVRDDNSIFVFSLGTLERLWKQSQSGPSDLDDSDDSS